MITFATPNDACDLTTLAGFKARLARHAHEIAWSAFANAADGFQSADRALALMPTPALWSALGDHWLPHPPADPDPAALAEIAAGLKDPRLGLRRWDPDPALYASHALCFSDVADAAGLGEALDWNLDSAEYARQLLARDLPAGEAAGIVADWCGWVLRPLPMSYPNPDPADGPTPASDAPPVEPTPTRPAERPPHPDRMSPKSAAAYAGVSAQTVYGWCGAGALAHSRVGAARGRGRIVIRRADLDAFLDSLRRPAATPASAPTSGPPTRRPQPAYRHLNVD